MDIAADEKRAGHRRIRLPGSAGQLFHLQLISQLQRVDDLGQVGVVDTIGLQRRR
ncbi:MAG: hypothetical protein ACK56I_04055 [bacterium]